jgi:hypothetical protein
LYGEAFGRFYGAPLLEFMLSVPFEFVTAVRVDVRARACGDVEVGGFKT